MRFYCDNLEIWRRGIPSIKKGFQYPCVVLEKDNWDDYSFHTSFNAAIYKSSKQRVHSGSIKILRLDHKNTSLPDSFENLSEDFCSLWQALEDYEVINKLDFGKDILSGLNDINYNEIIREKFRYEKGFNDSLRRYSEAERAFSEGIKVLTNSDDKSSFAFQYVEGAESSTPFEKISFGFSRKLLGMYRTIGLIGRNGVGKTTLLANLATALSGVEKTTAKLSRRPPFSKVIAVSYSTFDDFYRPSKNERTFSYSYCGIRGQDDLLTKYEIEQLFSSSYRKIVKKERETLWIECMEILFLRQLHQYFPSDIDVIKSFKNLSSGQKRVCK